MFDPLSCRICSLKLGCNVTISVWYDCVHVRELHNSLHQICFAINLYFNMRTSYAEAVFNPLFICYVWHLAVIFLEFASFIILQLMIHLLYVLVAAFYIDSRLAVLTWHIYRKIHEIQNHFLSLTVSLHCWWCKWNIMLLLHIKSIKMVNHTVFCLRGISQQNKTIVCCFFGKWIIGFCK